jgi:sulfide:quinone oxidoreductase
LTIMQTSPQRLHVVIGGGGVAAVELALALDDLAGERVRLTMIAPQPEFHLRALSTAQPFSVDHVRRHSLRDLAERVDAKLITDSVSAVDPARHAVRLATGGAVQYDALVLAVGARHRTAFSRAMTFTGDTSTLPFNGLLADLEEGWSHSVAFVVPPRTTWPLPLYELALMTARSVRGMGIDDARLEVISPEATPMALFGAPASRAVSDLLDKAGIEFRGESYASPGEYGLPELMPAGERIDAERIVALSTLEGPQLAGVPADERGFILIDHNGRVPGVDDVYAAGDGTTYPVKQGGLACQLADAIAEQLAAAGGADIEPQPFRPVLRGRLLIGRGAQYLEHPLHAAPGADPTPELQLWSAPRKVDGRYLSPWLEELDGTAPAPAITEPDHVDIEVELPSASELGPDAMRP